MLGRWQHLVCTFDGRKAELIVDGKRVAGASGAFNIAPWPGPLVVGQYSSPNATFQVQGRIGPVRVYRRAVSAAEAARWFRSGPPK